MYRKWPAVLMACVTIFLAGCSLSGTESSETQNPTTINTVQNEDTQQGEVGNTSDSTVQSTTSSQNRKILMNLYFANKDNSAVPIEKREVEVQNGAIMKAAIQALMAGPESADLRKAIPDGTKLLGIKREGNLAVVDFSKEFAASPGSEGVTARVSVVNTLIDLPLAQDSKILRVKILIEGKDMIGPSGEPLGELSKSALDSNGYPIPGEIKKIKVYFGNENADKVVPEQREVVVSKGDSLEAAAFAELMKGPVQKGHHPVIPEGTKLRSVKTENGLCTLNLSKEFITNSNSGTAGESMTINSIVNTLTEINGIKKVQFLIEGKKEPVYLHLVFDEPFSRNEDIIGK